MFRQPSKSVLIMFLFDTAVFIALSLLWCYKCCLPENFGAAAVFLTVAAGIFSLYLKENYKVREFNITGKNTYLLLEGVIFAHIPAAFLLVFTAPLKAAVLFIILNILSIFLILRLYRILFHIYLFKIKKEKKVLIIGSGAGAKLIAEEIADKRALKMKTAGFIKERGSENTGNSGFCAPVYEDIGSLNKIIADNDIDIVIIAAEDTLDEASLSKIVFNMPDNIDVYNMPEFYELITGRFYISRFTINRLFYDYMNRRSFFYDFFKRAFDIISALIILTVTFPVLLYIGIRVKLTDKGSALYTQNRIGRGGKVFKAYKLRTMYANDYKPENGVINADTSGINDDRVIPFCRFVRKARLDEIPQMINILKGDISITGPRCEWEDLVKIYEKEVPYYRCREWVNTGWTGWAQINQGHCVMQDDIFEKLQYDLYYLKRRNILWEICILIKAVFLALGGRHD